jgi:hypothetical protein
VFALVSEVMEAIENTHEVVGRERDAAANVTTLRVESVYGEETAEKAGPHQRTRGQDLAGCVPHRGNGDIG